MSFGLKRRGIFLCLIGPVASGKTSIRRLLLERGQGTLRPSVSTTTRAKRHGEVDGESYHFLSHAEFEKKVADGSFFEHEVVHGNRYGTLRKNLTDARDGGYDLIFDIDIRGALSLKREFPIETVNVFLLPPSLASLRSRIAGRAPMDEAEIERRLTTARTEYETLLSLAESGAGVDYVVVNDQLDDTFSAVSSLLSAERFRLVRLEKAQLKQLCDELLTRR